VKIADFGFSTIIENFGIDRHALQSVVGTPAYMAPEITDPRVWRYVDGSAETTGKKGYDGSADMWSLGVVFYVCLGGVFPFDSARPILDQILRGEFYFPDENFGDVSDEVIELICKLLVINPNKRLNCSQLLQQTWFNRGD
jgi:serine/threonine protein kinase